jgi:hypothetical protein
MAMTIFFVLNGLGVIFLLYVLANFWKEGHRQNKNSRNYATEFGRCDSSDVIVVTHPISHSAQGGLSVIPFQTRRLEFRIESSGGAGSHETSGVPVRRISTR